MRDTRAMTERSWTFSEREFYLAEFRGRTLGIALPERPADSLENLARVVAELAKNGTRCVVISPAREALEAVVPVLVEPAGQTDWVGELWRGLRTGMSAGLWLSDEASPGQGTDPFPARCRAAVLDLRLAKLVWIDARGSLQNDAGQRISLLDLADLAGSAKPESKVSDADSPLLGEFRQLLEGGVASVNVCSLAGLADELFTYAGSGTLLAPERYLEVRGLGVDDFDAAADLIARGVEEGFLAPRSPVGVEASLGQSFGVFVEGRYLAGIGALVGYPDQGMAEVASLYTVTRFAGEGVGGHLVAFALERARAAGFGRAFACTISDRVEAFFVRQGFSVVGPEEIPASKWVDYPADRQGEVRCLVRALD